MKYYLAPMEGITTYVFRQAYHRNYRPMDKYFTPFLVPHKHKGMSEREWNELNPEHNAGMYVVPQILTNDAEDFVKTAKMLYDYGYKEVNLNLGCPSKTVVSKGRGAGFLEDPQKLDLFFEQIFSALGDADNRVSVKTRIGLESPLEFEDLLKVYEKYPLKELIIHPRLQRDYYKKEPNWDVFRESEKATVHALCYNGDIFSVKDYQKFKLEFPKIECMMLGRGIIAHPDLLEQVVEVEERKIDAGSAEEVQKNMSDMTKKYQRLRVFHDDLLEGYRCVMSGDRNVLFKMKEFWSYCQKEFPDQPKIWKKIKKSESMDIYMRFIEELFAGV